MYLSSYGTSVILHAHNLVHLKPLKGPVQERPAAKPDDLCDQRGELTATACPLTSMCAHSGNK